MQGSSDGISRRSYLSIIGAGTATASLAGCSEETENGNSFEVSLTQGQMPTTLDPHDHRETSTRSVLLQAYERLLFRDKEGEIVEQLATDWERIEEGEVRFQIREDVEFHEGRSLTAEDCAYSIRRVIDDEAHITSPQSGQLAGITGSEARSDTDLRVFSDGFNPMVIASLASYCPVVNKEWTESREPSEIARETNGTGPFQIVEYEEGASVDFEAVDDYWGDEPAVDAATVSAADESTTRVSSLLANETDVITNVPPQEVSRIQDEEDTNISAVPSTRNLFIVLNDHFEPFSSREFRQAMNHAVDLNSIIENVLNGFGDPTGQPVIEGTVGYAEDVGPYQYDPDRAAQLVEESGYVDAEFAIHTPAGRYLGDLEVAQAVAEYIDDLPTVSCDVEQRDFSSLITEITDGDQETSPNAFLIGSSNPSRDASQKFNSWLLPSANTSHVSDETFTELYKEAQSEQDSERRAEILADINRRAHEQASLLFLHRQYSVYGLADRVNWEPRQDELIIVKEFNGGKADEQ